MGRDEIRDLPSPTRLWWWLLSRLSKRQSLLPATVLRSHVNSHPGDQTQYANTVEYHFSDEIKSFTVQFINFSSINKVYILDHTPLWEPLTPSFAIVLNFRPCQFLRAVMTNLNLTEILNAFELGCVQNVRICIPSEKKNSLKLFLYLFSFINYL